MDFARVDGERETLEDQFVRDGGVEVSDLEHYRAFNNLQSIVIE